MRSEEFKERSQEPEFRIQEALGRMGVANWLNREVVWSTKGRAKNSARC